MTSLKRCRYIPTDGRLSLKMRRRGQRWKRGKEDDEKEEYDEGRRRRRIKRIETRMNLI